MNATSRRLVLSPLPLFLALEVLLLVVHEPWRDEAQPWLIARDSWIVDQTDSEGSPGLWYFLLAPFARLGFPFVAARLLNVAIAASALALIVLRGPFSRFEEWLLAGGYFLVYEYGAITRSYALLLLLLLGVAALFPARREKPWPYVVLLALAANTTAHGAILAAIFAAELALALLPRRQWLPLIVPAAALGLAFLQLLPRSDLGAWRTDTAWRWWRFGLDQAVLGLDHAFVPFSDVGGWVWGRTWLQEAASADQLLWVGIVIYLVLGLLLLRAPRVLAMWLVGSLAIMAVFYLKFGVSGQMRHHDILLSFFLACLWMARDEAPTRGPQRAQQAVVAAILALQVVATVAPVWHDAREPFSGGPAAAEALRARGLDGPDTFIGVYPSFIAAPVLVELPNHPTMWFMQIEENGSFVRWTKDDINTFQAPRAGPDKLEAAAAAAGAKHVVLLYSFPYSSPEFDAKWERIAGGPAIAPGDAVYAYVRR